MKLLLVVFMIFISGCGFVTTTMFYFKSSLHYTQIEQEWEIIAPPTNTWVIEYRRSLLPEYFPYSDLTSLPGFDFNWLFSTFELNTNTKLAIFINFMGTYFTRKQTVNDGKSNKEYFTEYNYCINLSNTIITVSLSRADVDFNSGSVYLIVNNQHINGREMKMPYPTQKEYFELPPATYNLNAESTLATKNVFTKYRGDEPKFSTFFYEFPLTCRDYENAEFVLDGLSNHGEPLPPLHVRINYVEFDEVPAYVGKSENSRTNP